MSDVTLSQHAIERFNERVRPTLDRLQAEEELRRLLPFAQEVRDLDWHVDIYKYEAPPDYYLEISDGIALAVHGRTAVTCLIRNATSQRVRDKKSAKRKRRQKRSQARRSTQKLDQKYARYGRRDRQDWAA